MSRLIELQDLETQRAQLEKKIASMKADVESLSTLVEEITATAKEKKIKLRDIALALAPELDPERSTRKSNATAGTRQPRQLKTYKNPHNGEVVQTKGGNHKVLKAWKDKYGATEVESWLQK